MNCFDLRENHWDTFDLHWIQNILQTAEFTLKKKKNVRLKIILTKYIIITNAR